MDKIFNLKNMITQNEQFSSKNDTLLDAMATVSTTKARNVRFDNLMSSLDDVISRLKNETDEIFIKTATPASSSSMSWERKINETRNQLNNRYVTIRSPTETFLDDHQAQYSVMIALAAVLFVIGLSANLAVIGRVLRQGVLRARIRMLLLSLSCADVLFMVIEFPLNQFVWMSMRTWRMGDFLCRASYFARAFAAYLISFFLVVISLDRCLNTVKPAAPKAASKRMKKLLWCALLFALLCAMPQWLIFHVAKIPDDYRYVDRNLYQCVSRGLTENDNMIQVVYPLFTMICQYIIPIVLISLDYTIILYAMSKPVGQSDFQQLILFRQPAPTPTATTTNHHHSTSSNSSNSSSIKMTPRGHSSSHDSYIRKAQMKTLRILLITVAVFAMCWLPNYVVMLFQIGNPSLARKILPFWVNKIAELIAVSNACVNPFIYGNYLLKVKERCKSCWP